MKRIEEFTLTVALWVIRARWQEIQRFVLEFKATPDLVCCFFELVSYSFQTESIKYMNSGKISWL